jgi:hypothetical protein
MSEGMNVLTFRKIWAWVRNRIGNDASRHPAKDAPALEAHHRRHVSRVQDETLARVTFGLG